MAPSSAEYDLTELYTSKNMTPHGLATGTRSDKSEFRESSSPCNTWQALCALTSICVPGNKKEPSWASSSKPSSGVEPQRHVQAQKGIDLEKPP